MKKIKYIFLFLIFVLILGSVIISKHVLPYAIIQPPRVSENIIPKDFNLNSIDFVVSTKDSTDIIGYWVRRNEVPSKSILIFVHGIGGCKEHFLPLANNLSDLGIESVLFDSRAHGKSGGKYCTYGYKEKEDIGKIIDWIKSKNDSLPIGIWGNSMGGAIAIQALEKDNRIEFGIIESTFTELDQIVYDYQKSFTYGIGLKPLCTMALEKAGKLADFNPDLVSPINSVKQIEQPILIAHGTKDKRIKFEYGQLLFENLKSNQKKFIPIENAGHFNLSEKGGDFYREAILDFLVESFDK